MIYLLIRERRDQRRRPLTDDEREQCEARARAAWHASRELDHASRCAAAREAFGALMWALTAPGECWLELAHPETDLGPTTCGPGCPVDNHPHPETSCDD